MTNYYELFIHNQGACVISFLLGFSAATVIAGLIWLKLTPGRRTPQGSRKAYDRKLSIMNQGANDAQS